MPKTTSRQFKIFRDELIAWLGRLGVKGWNIDITQKPLEHDLSLCTTNMPDRLANIALADELPEDLSDYEIKTVAFHEANELLFARLNDLANERFVSERDIDTARHEIIATIQNVFFKPMT